MSVLWHCPRCNTSGELWRKSATFGQILREHMIASPKCREKDKIRFRGDDFDFKDLKSYRPPAQSHYNRDRFRWWRGGMKAANH